MPYLARVLNVMIASPSDVTQERLAIRDVITEWNTIHARDRKTVLMSVAWETHSVPGMGDRPQAIINKQLLKDADLLVAVFWTRLGSPTGVAQSGTSEEIEEHLKAGKPAMIYFSSVPVRRDSIEDDQYAALKEFKASLKSKGLYQEYDTPAEFRTKFNRHLAQKIIELSPSGRDGLTSMENVDYLAPIPSIGPEARELLIEASSDPQGTVMNLTTLDQGGVVQTNDRGFIEMGNPRSEARWRSAVDELARAGLLEDRGGEHELFFVTGEGYRIADLLKHSSDPAPLGAWHP
jgi:hypothetical protein